MKVVIAAAGTAGHINPGIAIANKIKNEENDSEIIFVGTNRGLENDLVPRAGYKLERIEAYGLSKNIKKDLKTLKGYFQAKKIIKKFRPDIVIGAGGYICGPVLMAAHSLKIPTMLHESNAFPGKAVKMLARFTNTIMVSFEEAKSRIPKAKKIVLTGTPIKINTADLENEEKNKIVKELKLDINKKIVLIFGGSQGAKKINEAVKEILINIGDEMLKYQIILSAGAKQYEELCIDLKEHNVDVEKIKNVRILPYIYNMGDIEKLSDILVCRSGAMTITEISALGKPAIFIPLPNVSNDHQNYNAKVLENINAAHIILNDKLNGEILNETIISMIKDENKLVEMGNNARKIYIADVEDRIYKEIQLLRKNKSSKKVEELSS